MNAYDATREKYYEGLEDSLNKRTLLLAYLQMHLNNAAMHPDDRMDSESGYCGWHMLLAQRVITTMGNLPDSFKYPTPPWRFVAWAYERFIDFHADDEDDTFLSKLDHVYNWLHNMTVLDLNAVVEDLEDLVQFHDGAPEEEFEVISGLCEILYWVSQFDK